MLSSLRIILLATVASVVVSTKPAHAGDTVWIRSIEEGEKLAQEQNKNLLIVFTGQGWCVNCMILEREVFSKEAFISATQDSFIRVELDYTFGESGQEQQRKQRLQQIAERFFISGYPSAVLTDKELRPFGYFVGYDEGYGVQRYIARIDAAQRAYEHLQVVAGSLQHSPNADGFSAFADALVKLSEYFDVEQDDDDPLVAFYKDEIDRLTSQLPASNAAIKKISERQKNQALREARESTWNPIANKLDEFYFNQDWRTASHYVQETSETLNDPYLQLRLNLQGIHFLSESEDFEQALAQVHEVLESPQLSFEQRRRLKNQESRFLLKLGKIDEAIALFDQRIAISEQARDQDQKSWLLSWKIQLMLSTDRNDETIAACRASREAAGYGSEDWQTATFVLAMKLRKAKRFEESLKYSTELYEVEPHESCMLDIAESNFELGKTSEAHKWVTRAEAAATRLSKSRRVGDQELAERIFERSAKLNKRFPEEK